MTEHTFEISIDALLADQVLPLVVDKAEIERAAALLELETVKARLHTARLDRDTAALQYEGERLAVERLKVELECARVELHQTRHPFGYAETGGEV
jgi:hypothetical protein